MTPPHEPEDEVYRPRLVRSYTITAGRTAAKVELAMEATLRLQPGVEAPVLSYPAAQVLEVCDRRSVAEIDPDRFTGAALKPQPEAQGFANSQILRRRMGHEDGGYAPLRSRFSEHLHPAEINILPSFVVLHP